jgi:Leucine Rich repeats (2 copies)
MKLNLSETKITDAALATLLAFPQLRSLDLSNTAITDAGFKQLAGLTNLDEVWIEGCNVSPAARGYLSRALPRCKLDPTWASQE